MKTFTQNDHIHAITSLRSHLEKDDELNALAALVFDAYRRVLNEKQERKEFHE